jgi:hypothetical protein
MFVWLVWRTLAFLMRSLIVSYSTSTALCSSWRHRHAKQQRGVIDPDTNGRGESHTGRGGGSAQTYEPPLSRRQTCTDTHDVVCVVKARTSLALVSESLALAFGSAVFLSSHAHLLKSRGAIYKTSMARPRQIRRTCDVIELDGGRGLGSAGFDYTSRTRVREIFTPHQVYEPAVWWVARRFAVCRGSRGQATRAP